jgi:hypothetical protein
MHRILFYYYNGFEHSTLRGVEYLSKTYLWAYAIRPHHYRILMVYCFLNQTLCNMSYNVIDVFKDKGAINYRHGFAARTKKYDYCYAL